MREREKSEESGGEGKKVRERECTGGKNMKEERRKVDAARERKGRGGGLGKEEGEKKRGREEQRGELCMCSQFFIFFPTHIEMILHFLAFDRNFLTRTS